MDHDQQNRNAFGCIGTAIAAEVVGVCVLTGISSSSSYTKSLSVNSINQCIDAVLENH